MKDSMSLENVEGLIAPADAMLAKQIGDKLNKAYDGYQWGVNCSFETGMLDIRLLDVTGRYGYRCKLRGVGNHYYSHSALEKQCLQGAGECLERFKLERGKMKIDSIMSLPRNSMGVIQGDLS